MTEDPKLEALLDALECLIESPGLQREAVSVDREAYFKLVESFYQYIYTEEIET